MTSESGDITIGLMPMNVAREELQGAIKVARVRINDLRIQAVDLALTLSSLAEVPNQAPVVKDLVNKLVLLAMAITQTGVLIDERIDQAEVLLRMDEVVS